MWEKKRREEREEGKRGEGDGGTIQEKLILLTIKIQW